MVAQPLVPPVATPLTASRPHCPQNDRVKALKAMEMTWNNMEKKEKLMWIKKAAEDQKRYEVRSWDHLLPHTNTAFSFLSFPSASQGTSPAPTP